MEARSGQVMNLVYFQAFLKSKGALNLVTEGEMKELRRGEQA